MTAAFLAGLGGGFLLALAYGMGRAAARPYPACPCLDEPVPYWPGDDARSVAADREAEQIFRAAWDSPYDQALPDN